MDGLESSNNSSNQQNGREDALPQFSMFRELPQLLIPKSEEKIEKLIDEIKKVQVDLDRIKRKIEPYDLYQINRKVVRIAARLKIVLLFLVFSFFYAFFKSLLLFNGKQ